MLLRYGGLLVTLLTILGIGVVLLPYFWMVSSSLKTGAEVFELPIRWIPQVLQWANYPNALSRGSFGIFLMRQYIKSLPDSLIEAARLDGCSEFGIFWRIILPNCKPALGALALLSFRDTWDQFLWPFIVASDDALKTFPLGLAQMEGIDSAAYHEIMAIAVMGMIPAALIFLVFQRAFVRGIALTGLKE